MRRRVSTIAVVLLMAAALGGCGGSSGSGDGSSPPASPHENHASASVGLSPSSPASTVRRIQVTVRDGKVSPDHGRVVLRLGERVRVEVTSDSNDELHVHAYDKRVEVSAGQVAVLEFVADIPGTFEVELENSKLHLFDLRVS